MQLTFDLQPGDDRLFTDESLEQIERIEQGLLELDGLFGLEDQNALAGAA